MRKDNKHPMADGCLGAKNNGRIACRKDFYVFFNYFFSFGKNSFIDNGADLNIVHLQIVVFSANKHQ